MPYLHHPMGPQLTIHDEEDIFREYVLNQILFPVSKLKSCISIIVSLIPNTSAFTVTAAQHWHDSKQVNIGVYGHFDTSRVRIKGWGK